MLEDGSRKTEEIEILNFRLLQIIIERTEDNLFEKSPPNDESEGFLILSSVKTPFFNLQIKQALKSSNSCYRLLAMDY